MSGKTANDFLEQANKQIKTISSLEAKEKKDEIIFIDVRDKHERDNEPGIEGSVLLSRGMLEFYADKTGPYFNQLLNTEKKIVVFCTLGARGALAAKTLQEMGYDNIYNLKDGLQDWKEQE